MPPQVAEDACGYSVPVPTSGKYTITDEAFSEEHSTEEAQQTCMFRRDSISRRAIQKRSNRFVLNKKYRKVRDSMQPDYSVDPLTNDPVVAGIDLHPSVVRLRSGSISSSSHSSSMASSRPGSETSSDVVRCTVGCRESCICAKKRNVIVQLDDLGSLDSVKYFSRPADSSAGGKKKLLHRSNSVRSTRRPSKPSIGGMIQQCATDSLHRCKSRHGRNANVDLQAAGRTTQVTPIENDLMEVRKCRTSLDRLGDCWIITGSRLTELLLLVNNASLVNFCNFTVTDSCKDSHESMCTLFECMKICNRWSPTEVVPIRLHRFSYASEGPVCREQLDSLIWDMSSKLKDDSEKRLLMDVTGFSEHHGYSKLRGILNHV